MAEHYFTEKPTSEFILNKVQSVIRGKTFYFYTAPGVFSKDHVDPGTKLLAETMETFPGDRVLDLGCGYGVLGIVAKKIFDDAEVVLSDVNERALELSRMNAEMNNVDVQIVKSNLFESLDEEFNVIISNPPFVLGKDFIKRFIKESYDHLSFGGVLEIVTTKKYRYVEKMMSRFFDVKLMAKDGHYLIYFGVKKKGD